LLCSLLLSAEGQRLYDCDAELFDWKHLWTPEWKAWCCANEQKGCPSTSTSTGTSTTQTTTTVTTVTETSTTRTTTTINLCEASCPVDDTVATCKERIRWATTHETAQDATPCDAALALLATQCPEACGECVQAASAHMWCEADASTEKDMHFLQRFEPFETHRVSTGIEARLRPAGAVLALGLFVSLVGSMVAGRFGQAWHRRQGQAEQEEQLIE